VGLNTIPNMIKALKPAYDFSSDNKLSAWESSSKEVYLEKRFYEFLKVFYCRLNIMLQV
jgi:hypothetical protein